MTFWKVEDPSILARVFVTECAHIQRYEIVDVADTERALARFAGPCRVDGAAP